MDQHNTEWTPGTKKCDLNVRKTDGLKEWMLYRPAVASMANDGG